MVPLPTPNLTPVCRGWEGCQLPEDPFPSSNSTLGCSCGDGELTVRLCVPQDAMAGLHPGKAHVERRAEHDPATVSPPSLHGTVWNGNTPLLKWVLQEGQPLRTAPGSS